MGSSDEDLQKKKFFVINKDEEGENNGSKSESAPKKGLSGESKKKGYISDDKSGKDKGSDDKEVFVGKGSSFGDSKDDSKEEKRPRSGVISEDPKGHKEDPKELSHEESTMMGGFADVLNEKEEANEHADTEKAAINEEEKARSNTETPNDESKIGQSTYPETGVHEDKKDVSTLETNSNKIDETEKGMRDDIKENTAISQDNKIAASPQDNTKKGSENQGQSEHVKIDETRNSNINVGKSTVPGGTPAAAFTPAIMTNPCEGSKVSEYRDAGQVDAEGYFWKKRRLFYCFWHQKYFVLLKDGQLVYHKCDGSRYAKGKWNIREAMNLQKISVENAWCHPYRIALEVEGSTLYFSYNDEASRDFWYEKFDAVSKRTD